MIFNTSRSSWPKSSSSDRSAVWVIFELCRSQLEVVVELGRLPIVRALVAHALSLAVADPDLVRPQWYAAPPPLAQRAPIEGR